MNYLKKTCQQLAKINVYNNSSDYVAEMNKIEIYSFPPRKILQ